MKEQYLFPSVARQLNIRIAVNGWQNKIRVWLPDFRFVLTMDPGCILDWINRLPVRDGAHTKRNTKNQTGDRKAWLNVYQTRAKT